MTNNDPLQPNADDARRAAALTVHYGRGNEDGVKALIAETAEEGRAMQLIFSLLALTDEVMPAIYTREGLQIMSSHVVRLAGMAEDEK